MDRITRFPTGQKFMINMRTTASMKQLADACRAEVARPRKANALFLGRRHRSGLSSGHATQGEAMRDLILKKSISIDGFVGCPHAESNGSSLARLRKHFQRPEVLNALTFIFAGSGSGSGSGFLFRFASTSFFTAAR
jgi:hypothetical protein